MEETATGYSKRLAFPAPLQIGLWVLVVGLAAYLGYSLVFHEHSAFSRIVIVTVGTLSLGAVVAVRGRVSVRGGELRMELWPYWRRAVDTAAVVSVEPIEVHPLIEAGVLGVGRLSENTWMLALRSGPGARVELEDGRVFFLGIDSPEELERALKAVEQSSETGPDRG